VEHGHRRVASSDIRTESNRLVLTMLSRAHARVRPTPALERGLVDDLESVGVIVSDVWDLVNTRQRYPQAITALMRWLDSLDAVPVSTERERFREGLIRSLTVPDARPAAAGLLLNQFRTATNETIRWAASNALSVVADSGNVTDVLDLVRQRRYGTARQMMVDALPRIGGRKHREAVVDTLIELLHDDDVTIHAISAVRRIRADRSRPALEKLLEHENSTIRRRAKDALTRLP
jgi:hypothetical protein